MATLKDRVDAVLAARLDDYDSRLEEYANRLSGIVVSSAFAGLEHEERQRLLASALRSELGKDELAHIGAIVTATPAEAEVGEPVD